MSKVLSVLVVLVVALMAVSAVSAQIPTPAAELFDGEAAVGTAWPLVLLFLGILAVPFALVFGKSLTSWVGGLITRFAKR